MEISSHSIALQFAGALDREDYDAARRLLAQDCVYTICGKRIESPTLIIDSYKKTGDWVKTVLEVKYESHVHAVADNFAIITFIDIISCRGQSCQYRCEQHLHTNFSGDITRIEHVEIPGEREKIDQFLATHGIQRPDLPAP